MPNGDHERFEKDLDDLTAVVSLKALEKYIDDCAAAIRAADGIPADYEPGEIGLFLKCTWKYTWLIARSRCVFAGIPLVAGEDMSSQIYLDISQDYIDRILNLKKNSWAGYLRGCVYKKIVDYLEALAKARKLHVPVDDPETDPGIFPQLQLQPDLQNKITIDELTKDLSDLDLSLLLDGKTLEERAPRYGRSISALSRRRKKILTELIKRYGKWK